ncbi:MalY/PatB family protein [Actinotignum urinale]|uniref:MalY/PatB family protein n=1 Tax=Actinotignum urinale TaxID=190146 RepID=UPI00280BCC93|nr:aminotransferase class I/II-fold pyridoxal phosphate-dependent enzyme [Actinotignum urinale]
MDYGFDSRTIAQLQLEGSRKWTAFPGSICMWVAEMDLGIAPEIRDYLIAEARRGTLGYLPPQEATEIVEATATWLSQFGEKPEPKRMHLIPEVLAGLRVAIDYFTPAGAPVIVPTPAYMPFLTIPGENGHEVREIPSIFDASRWEMDFEAIEATLEPDALFILCNPHNPTGRCFSREELTRLSDIIDRAGARVFEDGIHAPLILDGTYIPYGTLNDATRTHTVSAVAASKGWNIPGLKCAQLIFHNDDDATRFEPHTHAICAATSTVGARAARVAFEEAGAWRTAAGAYLAENMRILEERVAGWDGARVAHAEGTYIAFIDFSETRFMKEALAEDPHANAAKIILERAGVALTTGTACGAEYGAWARLIAATPRAVLHAALDAIETLM